MYELYTQKNLPQYLQTSSLNLYTANPSTDSIHTQRLALVICMMGSWNMDPPVQADELPHIPTTFPIPSTSIPSRQIPYHSHPPTSLQNPSPPKSRTLISTNILYNNIPSNVHLATIYHPQNNSPLPILKNLSLPVKKSHHLTRVVSVPQFPDSVHKTLTQLSVTNL